MKKPTPDELAQLRELFPAGTPRVDYREMTLLVGARATPADGDPEDAIDGGADEGAENAPIPLAISSEAPVLRYDWWTDERYWEVLDHARSSVDLSYASDGLPFVASHRAWDADQQHGIVEQVMVGKDRILRGLMKPSRAQRSQEIAQDMRDGIRKKVSVGYVVGDAYTQTEGGADGVPVRRYTAWMPLEVSTVPVPADYAVGVDRARSLAGSAQMARFLELHPAPARAAAPASAEPAATAPLADVSHTTTEAPKAEERSMADQPLAPVGGTPTPAATAGTDRTAENAAVDRVRSITAMAVQHGFTERLNDWLTSDKSELQISREINDGLAERMAKPIQTVRGPQLSPKDEKRFSIARALMLNTDLMKECGPKIDFGFEREMEQEARSTMAGGMQKGGNALAYSFLGRAGLDSGTATAGGSFKFTEPGDFIPILRNKTSVLRAGATVLSGLTGPVTFPKQSAAAGYVFSAENPGSDISVTNLTTTTVTLAFKSIAAGAAFSRQLLFSAASGNNDIESIVRNDLAAVIGIAIDLGALNGSGTSNQPSGVLVNTSIGSVTLGANGGAISWNEWVDLETKIAQSNADTSRMAYITNASQRGKAKKTAVLGNTASGVTIWTGKAGEMDGEVNGYRAISSEQVPSNLTKGTSTTVCSAVLFGAFEHLLVGMFGAGVETIVDPYSKKYQGMVEVAAWCYMDSQLRYPGAFAAVKDAL